MNADELEAVFEELGAPDPHGWAQSEVEEGINQLGRFLFLKGGWDLVVDDDDTGWMDRLIQQTPPDRQRPFDGVAHALRNLLAAGAGGCPTRCGNWVAAPLLFRRPDRTPRV